MEEFVMRPGETFVADECGCRFTVESGPGDAKMATQAPRCCCGHAMHRVGQGNSGNGTETAPGNELELGDNGAPQAMAD